MAKETIEALIEGGKATAAPPLGPALGPLGVNIGQIVAAINDKTKEFKGMQVPVKVIVDSDSKEFTIEVGTPPAAALILKEAGIKKGASNPIQEKVADLRIEQLIRVAKMKEGQLLGKDLKNKVKEIVGTCDSMGVLVEGVAAREAIKQINEGKFDEEIKAEKTELSAEEQKEVEAEKKLLQEEMAKKRTSWEARIKAVMKEMEGKERGKIKTKLLEEKIPETLIEELLPADDKKKK